ncbi:hypothetical protein [Flavobacterium sp.]|uniref:hypothetical protein n=1 Tax=Flavobacterium sp. TaxID=239 RepID=UPI00260BAA36|nr:hypothetical protein [Flavobacterium sp.]
MKTRNHFFITVVILIIMNVNVNGQSNNTFTGVGAGTNNSGSSNSGYGVNSLQNNTSNSNSAFGLGTLSNSSGGFNCAFGNSALTNNTLGDFNCSFGTRSLENNTSGRYNIAIGHRSLGDLNTTGSQNIAIGYASLLRNNGNSNIAIGHYIANNNLNGSNNVFIGGSGTTDPGSNKLFIHNNNHPSPLIYGEFDNRNLKFNVIGSSSSRVEITSGVNNNYLNGTSGLRFTNLTSATNVVANPSNPPKVLSVNANGDVILVNDTVGTGSGGSTTIIAGTNIAVSGTSTSGYTISSPYQTLSQDGNTITLSNGGQFTLPTFTDTDAQTLSFNSNILNHTNDISISNGNTIQVPMTYISPGSNTSITGNGSQLNPYIISSTSGSSGTDLSIYNDNGIINQSTTTGLNRIVDLNDRNIWFNSATSNNNGRVYIGNTAVYPTINSNYRLYVEGGILTERVKVALRSTANWADYVFANDYKLMPLKDVETYITRNKHLPGIESAETLSKNGLDLADMQTKQMAKIEELTLYVIQQNNQIEKQNKEIEELKALVKTLLDRK